MPLFNKSQIFEDESQFNLAERIGNLSFLKVFNKSKYTCEISSLCDLMSNIFGNEAMQKLSGFGKSSFRRVKVDLVALCGEGAMYGFLIKVYYANQKNQPTADVGLGSLLLGSGVIALTIANAAKYYLRGTGAQILYEFVGAKNKDGK